MKEKIDEEELIYNSSEENNYINEGEDEVFSKYSSSIPETSSNKIFKSIVKIELNNCIGTGFLIRIKTKLKLITFLLTCNHIIEQKHIDSNEIINIFFGNKNDECCSSILLDPNKRFIKCFKKPIDITIIQILLSDSIVSREYLIPDYNYKKGYDIYLEKNFYLAGYPMFKSNHRGERHICSGKIISIQNNYEFTHTLDTFGGSSGSPLCLINDQAVVGIHKKGNKLTGYNYGTFIGVILDYCSTQEIEDKDDNDNSFSLPKLFEGLVEYGKIEIKQKINEFFVEPMKQIVIRMFKFYNLEEYNKNISDFHNIISKHYKNQNDENFDINIEKLINFLNKEKIVIQFADNKKLDFNNDLFLSQLMDLKNNNGKNINEELLDNINNLLSTENEKILEKISYFIAKVMMELNSFPFLEDKNCILEFEEFMNIDYLKQLQKSKDKIVFITSFVKVEKKVNTFFSSLFDKIDSFKKIVRKLFDFQYKIKILINYNYKENYIPTCFKYLEDNNYIFLPFTFFKIVNIEINSNNNSGIISLDCIGRKEILENNDNLKNGLIYNNIENNIEIKNNE